MCGDREKKDEPISAALECVVKETQEESLLCHDKLQINYYADTKAFDWS